MPIALDTGPVSAKETASGRSRRTSPASARARAARAARARTSACPTRPCRRSRSAPKTTAKAMNCHTRGAEGVADEGQRGDDPRAVGEGQVAPGRPALADDERREHRAGAGGREDRAVAPGAGVEVVAHDERAAAPRAGRGRAAGSARPPPASPTATAASARRRRASRSSRRAERSASGAGSERTRSAQMHAALIAKVPASTRKAPPAPTAATMRPPTAGPSSRSARLAHELVERVGLDEVAGARRSRAPARRRPGRRRPRPRRRGRRGPRGARSRARRPATARRSAASTSARTRSAAISTLRRSMRSLTMPPVSRKAVMPPVHASPTSDSAPGRCRCRRPATPRPR